jgi:hypothetical protein
VPESKLKQLNITRSGYDILTKREITLLDVSKAYEQIPLKKDNNERKLSTSYRTHPGSIDLDENDNDKEYW